MTKLFTIFSNISFRARLLAMVVTTMAYVVLLLYFTANTFFSVNQHSSAHFVETARKSTQITRILNELDVLIADEKKEIIKYSGIAKKIKIIPKRINYSIIEQEILRLQPLLTNAQERDNHQKLTRQMVMLKDVHLQIYNKLYTNSIEDAVKLDLGLFDQTRLKIKNQLLQLLTSAEKQLYAERQTLEDSHERQFLWILFITLLYATVLFTSVLVMRDEFRHLTNTATKALNTLAQGDSTPFRLNTPINELGGMNTLINKLGDYLENIAKNLKAQQQDDAPFSLVSSHDRIGKLLNLQNQKKVELEQQLFSGNQKFEYTEWVYNGIKLFNDTLSRSAYSEEALADEVIQITIEYLKLPMAGFYTLIEEENKTYLRLDATYAYDKKRLYTRNVDIGEGLVGAAVIEKSMSIHNNVPTDYFVIGSGMGEAKPKRLLVLPLLHNDLVVGVMEMASFSEFSQIQLDFIQQVAPNIGVALSTVKASAHNQRVLHENEKYIAKLSETEQALRRELEQYKLQVNDLENKEEDLQRYSKAIETNTVIVELNTEGQIMSFNKRFEKLSKFSETALMHTKIENFIFNADQLSLFQAGKPMQTIGNEKLLLQDRHRTKIPIIASLTWSTIYHNRVFLIGMELGEHDHLLGKFKDMAVRLRNELTEVKSTNEKLRLEQNIERNRKLEEMQITSALMPIIPYATFSLDWQLIKANKRFLKEFAIDNPKTFNLKDIVISGQVSKFEIIEASLKNHNTHHSNIMLQLGNRSVWYDIDHVPILDMHKQVTHYFLVFRNNNSVFEKTFQLEKQNEKTKLLNKEIEKLRDSLATVETRMVELEKYAELQMQLEKIQHEKETMAQDAQQLKATTKQLQNEKDKLKTAQQQFLLEIEKSKQNNIQTSQRLQVLEADIQAKEAKQKELNTELQQLKAANAIFERQYNETLAALERYKQEEQNKQIEAGDALKNWLDELNRFIR